jgi:hypothetical protein
MSELSPAAQAVLRADAGARCVSEWDSVNDPPCHPSDSNWNGCFDCVNHSAVAAALRVVADQVVPEVVNPVGDEHDAARADQWRRIRLKILAIAAELESQ